MRLPTRTPRGRHFSGRALPQERPVRDELEPPGGPLLGIDIPIDIDANDAWEGDQPRARVTRSRVAFAVSITLAALPVLVLDNFPATADTGAQDRGPVSVHADDAAADDSSDALDVQVDLSKPLHGTADLEAPASVVTIAPPTIYVDTPVTTVTLPPITTAPPTTVARRVAPTTTTPTTVKTAPTTTAPVRAAIEPSPDDPATWDALARCEAGGNWAANTGNGYYGGLQFSLATWQDLGGTGYPHEASKADQIEIGRRLQARSGWDAWPGCARKLGWT